MRVTKLVAAFLFIMCAVATSASRAQSSAAGIQTPGPDVPANCAAFSGGWSGEWPRIGRAFLWVMSVAPDCTAQVLYGKSFKPTPAAKLSQATIKGETLSLPRPDGGTTIFDHKGNAIMGRYRGPSGFNEALMERVGVDAASRLDAEQRAQSAMIPVPSDVPPECVAFYGQWIGTWSQGNFGEQYLRVVELKPAGGSCTVRYSYSSSRTPIAAKHSAEVKDGVLAFVCNSSTGGTCVFKPAGNDLSASYTNSAGGRNSAMFRKLQ